ncbi:MAG: hypothetical protein ABI016_12570 [Chthoniobacterales bacterium]
MKSLLLCALVLSTVSCTTLSNRRDLYNPSEDVGPYYTLQPKNSNVGGAPAPQEEPLPPSP